jgi:hypothetical protein
MGSTSSSSPSAPAAPPGAPVPAPAPPTLGFFRLLASFLIVLLVLLPAPQHIEQRIEDLLDSLVGAALQRAHSHSHQVARRPAGPGTAVSGGGGGGGGSGGSRRDHVIALSLRAGFCFGLSGSAMRVAMLLLPRSLLLTLLGMAASLSLTSRGVFLQTVSLREGKAVTVVTVAAGACLAMSVLFGVVILGEPVADTSLGVLIKVLGWGLMLAGTLGVNHVGPAASGAGGAGGGLPRTAQEAAAGAAGDEAPDAEERKLHTVRLPVLGDLKRWWG